MRLRGFICLIHLLAAVGVSAPAAAQTDASTNNSGYLRAATLTGMWQGSATAGRSRFDYQWVIRHADRELTGTISLSMPGRNDWASYDFEGELIGEDLVRFRGTRWRPGNIGNFCIASGVLRLVSADRMQGTWGPNPVNGGCAEGLQGKVTLTRQ